jgi:hypothetical protein
MSPIWHGGMGPQEKFSGRIVEKLKRYNVETGRWRGDPSNSYGCPFVASACCIITCDAPMFGRWPL